VDNVTAWVNGSEVIRVASTYRSHFRTDRHRAWVKLLAGENTLLLKLTKTPPTSEGSGSRGGPADKWDFSARFVDNRGQGLTFTQGDRSQ
jgi:hypothetical protein